MACFFSKRRAKPGALLVGFITAFCDSEHFNTIYMLSVRKLSAYYEASTTLRDLHNSKYQSNAANECTIVAFESVGRLLFVECASLTATLKKPP